MTVSTFVIVSRSASTTLLDWIGHACGTWFDKKFGTIFYIRGSKKVSDNFVGHSVNQRRENVKKQCPECSTENQILYGTMVNKNGIFFFIAAAAAASCPIVYQ